MSRRRLAEWQTRPVGPAFCPRATGFVVLVCDRPFPIPFVHNSVVCHVLNGSPLFTALPNAIKLVQRGKNHRFGSLAADRTFLMPVMYVTAVPFFQSVIHC